MKLILLNIGLFAAITSCAPIPPVGYSGSGHPSHPGRPGEMPSYSQVVRPTKPSLERLANGHYRVLADWPVRVSGRDFLVQKGYTSNGITAPKSIKSFLGDHVNAPETWAAVFHDWCFTQKNLTRAQCDNYYIQLMRDYRINPQKISLMGTTVRGYSIYKGN